MDPIQIATAVVAFLVPYLVEGGKTIAKKSAEALWDTIKHRLVSKPAASEALHDIETHPEDPDVQAVLRVQLRKVFEEDAKFLAKVNDLLEKTQGDLLQPTNYSSVTGSGAIAQGEKSVAAGAGGIATGRDVNVTSTRNIREGPGPSVKSERISGTVKWYSPEKGYGFITRDGGGEDVFVQYSALQIAGYQTLEKGQRVEFKVSYDDKGSSAKNITKL